MSSPSASHPAKTKTETAPPLVQPSYELRVLIRDYFELLDGSDAGTNQEAIDQNFRVLLRQMRAEHIPFHSEIEARWIARWIYTGVPVERGKRTVIMFARTPAHLRYSEYDPIRHGVSELTSVPFADSEDERNNAVRSIPVLVTIEPLYDYEGFKQSGNGWNG